MAAAPAADDPRGARRFAVPADRPGGLAALAPSHRRRRTEARPSRCWRRTSRRSSTRPRRCVAGDLDAMRALARTLVLSGLGMTICNGSYPASQGEHLISHYIDMYSPPGRPDYFHGEQVAVATLTMARIQEEMLAAGPPTLEPSPMTEAELLHRLGPELGASCWREFLPKRMSRANGADAREAGRATWTDLAGTHPRHEHPRGTSRFDHDAGGRSDDRRRTSGSRPPSTRAPCATRDSCATGTRSSTSPTIPGISPGGGRSDGIVRMARRRQRLTQRAAPRADTGAPSPRGHGTHRDARQGLRHHHRNGAPRSRRIGGRAGRSSARMGAAPADRSSTSPGSACGAGRTPSSARRSLARPRASSSPAMH